MHWVVKTGLFLLILLAIGCESKNSDATADPSATPTASAVTVPPQFQKGEAAFNSNCAVCHGIGGVGTDTGPPFLDRVYEPNHHGDQAFYRAAMQGVRAHHWKFGNMPPVEGMTKDLMVDIISYIRWTQRQAGIH